ncbi:glutathione-independent formaldehyde dehydrogenase [Bradyrhizobium sp. U87765 SZCCT0131]|uniref:Glutathione-independent formaldehyde dehydrogenase n=4 Tax=Alphaproteobacteria TaxID=28211 RepID=A0A927EDH7_9HYPH|nr:glutathione-independent formaldehyde dehydrogenase [Bosea spartocytisi]MBR1216459.1 glutathione-independent formaldehyde dehydrogenase [Bradyrhizobium sp. U87765 SZCCT0131]MBR1259792.1 glutathione-independent formaldehyde dehydrogenase [Bradyrhizobium sp. U87765 SZCCT0134]MBR1305926.1 glutathione-independent formaldehyde dehydrogenase [Bradyrhizobium sp. U87765 SZCCT0110]MBR1322293.1 glutathione-independent formaldehyde dehydrogenase [Bradyrhizobium sp. U87765 SZCCT0109]MBR1352417.1 glutath
MMATGNRIVTFEKPMEMKVNTFKFPELITPQGKRAPHGAILKIVTTNICGSDLHIYRGSFEVPKGMTMGHEMTGEVIEVGSDVEYIKVGDIVSVPFNVGCGRCYNCKHMRSEVCENTNPEVDCGAYGFNLGGWTGGQGDYLFVPYADFNLLAFPDKDAAMEKIRDLTLLSDVLPTAFHGFAAPDWPAQPSYIVGENVLIFGAGPVGRAGAACARLLGAGAIIVADFIQERLDLLKPHGIETINLSDGTPIEDHLERITGKRQVDRVIDYVGLDCRGFGPDSDKIVENAVTNALLKYVRFGGMTSTVGVYCPNPISKDPLSKKGSMEVDWASGWIKSPRMSAGQSPTANYNHALMRAILNDRMPYLTPMMNIKFIALEDAPAAYKEFDDGSAFKYVIDPHGSVKH